MFVRLVPRAERHRHQEQVEQELRSELQRIGGVTAWISGDMFGNIKQIQVELRGEDVTELNRLAARVSDILRDIPGVVDLGLSTKGQKPELEVQMDRALAGTIGVTVGQVAQALRPAFAGIDVGDWVDPIGETRDVRVRLVPEARTNVADLESLRLVLPGPDGPVTMPLGQVARIRPGIGPARIDHSIGSASSPCRRNTERRSAK